MGEDEIADSKRSVEGAGEGSRVGDTALRIEDFEGLDGAALASEIAVEVVF